MGDEFNFCIQEQAKSLKSVIGVELKSHELLPPNLKFITSACGAGGGLEDPLRPVLFKRSQSNPADLKPVLRNSTDWHIAHGTAHFQVGGRVTKQNEIIENFARYETGHRRIPFKRLYNDRRDFSDFWLIDDLYWCYLLQA